MRQEGFTLIELLLTISIIGFIATMSLITFDNTRIKAREAKMNSDLRQIILAIDLARADKNKVLGDITGSFCSACACSGGYETSSCIDRFNYAFRALGFPGLLKDPWGIPYILDENEYEWSWDQCRCDTVHSAGHSANILINPFLCDKCH